MAIIKAKNGECILVDNDRYKDLSKYKWTINNSGYPRTTIRGAETPMHKLIFGDIAGQRLTVINGVKRDMRLKNITTLYKGRKYIPPTVGRISRFNEVFKKTK